MSISPRPKWPSSSDDRPSATKTIFTLVLSLVLLLGLLSGLWLFLQPSQAQPPMQWCHGTWNILERRGCVIQVNLGVKAGSGSVLLTGIDGPGSRTTLPVDDVQVYGDEVAFAYKHRGRTFWNGLKRLEDGEVYLYGLEVLDGLRVGPPGEPGTVWPAFIDKNQAGRGVAK